LATNSRTEFKYLSFEFNKQNVGTIKKNTLTLSRVHKRKQTMKLKKNNYLLTSNSVEVKSKFSQKSTWKIATLREIAGLVFKIAIHRKFSRQRIEKLFLSFWVQFGLFIYLSQMYPLRSYAKILPWSSLTDGSILVIDRPLYFPDELVEIVLRDYIHKSQPLLLAIRCFFLLLIFFVFFEF
jgi:hypothetical protein